MAGQAEASTTPFNHLSANAARAELKRRVAALGVKGASQHNLHDLRRGHAQDMAESGSNIYEILGAGEWVSPAFIKYMDVAKLDGDAALDAHWVENDSCDDE